MAISARTLSVHAGAVAAEAAAAAAEAAAAEAADDQLVRQPLRRVGGERAHERRREPRPQRARATGGREAREVR